MASLLVGRLLGEAVVMAMALRNTLLRRNRLVFGETVLPSLEKSDRSIAFVAT
jgi:hypothetical protein